MSNSSDKTKEAVFIDAHPELRAQVERDPLFQALLARMHCLKLHGEVLYLRPSELRQGNQEKEEEPVQLGQDDVPKDKEQLIIEYAQAHPKKFPVIHEYR